jgi:hypothetical protein
MIFPVIQSREGGAFPLVMNRGELRAITKALHYYIELLLFEVPLLVFLF